MQTFIRSSLVVVLATLTALAQTTPPSAAAKDVQQPEAKKSEAPSQMMTYQMVLFKQAPPKPAPASMPCAPPAAAPSPADMQAKVRGHLANLARRNAERVNLIYGPFIAEEPSAPTLKGLAGFAIVEAPDAASALKLFEDDPFVRDGDMVLEVKKWLGPRDWFAPPAKPAADDPAKMEMEPLIFGILVRGPAGKNPPPEHTPEVRREIQRGHLAYMDELHKQGKLLMAGPFMEDGDWRGIVVYRVASVADAQALAANDPAVKAGRLVLEARPWMTLKGILK